MTTAKQSLNSAANLRNDRVSRHLDNGHLSLIAKDELTSQEAISLLSEACTHQGGVTVMFDLASGEEAKLPECLKSFPPT